MTLNDGWVGEFKKKLSRQLCYVVLKPHAALSSATLADVRH